MQIPKNIEIKDATGRRVAFLSPKADGLKDCYPDIRLNGESTLEFSLPATSEKIEEITPECEIWAGGRVYNLRKDDAIDTVRDDNNKLWTKVMAVERWSELDTSYLEPSISNDPTALPPADLAVVIVGGGSNLSSGRFATGTAGHALHAILQGSKWTVGIVDITTIRDLEMEKASRLALVKQIQNIWGGYLVWDSVNRVVHLRDAHKWQNYTGFQVRYRKNLKHITRTQSNKLVTKLYAFGYEDLDISSINGGKKYVTNNDYTSRVYIGIYRNPDIHYQDELLEKAKAELELVSRPRHLYKIKMVDLRTLPEYEHEQYELGDMADIVDSSVAPDSPRPRIIRHKYNLFRPWECELDIGDPEERLIEQLKASFKTSGFIDGVFDGNGNMSGENLTDESIAGKKIRVKSIEIGHLSTGFIPGLDLLQNPVFSSYAEQVGVIDGVVTTQGTLIQQNASQISLQAVSINGLGSDIARLDIRADEISTSVADTRTYVDTSISTVNNTITNVQTTISGQISSINQRADSIVLSVSNVSETVATNYTALDGKISSLSTTVTQNQSSINQRADSIVLSVSNVSETVATNYTALDGKISSLSTTVTQNQSSINQRADSIVLSVSNVSETVATNYTALDGKISSLSTTVTQNQSSINQRADSIVTSVSSLSNTVTNNYNALDGDIRSLSTSVSSNSSQITQLSNSITSIVSFTDVTGNQIASKINQTAEAFSIDAGKINLNGITRVNKVLQLGSSGIDMGTLKFHNNASIFADSDGAYGVNLTISSATLDIEGRTSFSNEVDFTGATVKGFTLKFA